MPGAPDLGGEWDGIFSYPRDLPPTAFTAALREHGGIVTGETSEAGRGGTLFALIEGQRTGNRVTFVKSYDDHHARPIDYAGILDAEATEISGTWRIPGNWSGSFIMVRRSHAVEQDERVIEETVRR